MTKAIVWVVAALSLPVGLTVGPFQQPKPTAVLAGTVRSDDGTPVAGAVVSILSTQRNGIKTAVTDQSGEFSFEGLAAGSFVVWATKDGSLPSYYGSTHPGSGPVKPVVLANGQRLAVSMTMLSGAGIGGRITDPSGRPVPQVLVQIRPVSSLDTAAPQTSKTDSDGRYLVFGLAAGEYIVEALPPLVAGSVPAFAPTFSPGVAFIAEAKNIVVTAGEQRDDVMFSLYRAARVSGRVVVPNGQAISGVSIMLIPTEAAMPAIGGAGSRHTAKAARVTVSDTGEFSVSGVIPGTYALFARWDANSSDRAAGPDATTLWGEQTVVVNGPDVSGVVVSLQRGARVSGTIMIETASRAPPTEALRFTLSPKARATAAFIGSLAATPDASGKVVFPSVPPGLYDLRIAPREIAGSSADTWLITSAIAAGHEVADAPFDIRPGGGGVDVIFTLTETEISGTVLDDGGQPGARLPLLFFAVDRASWTPGSRRVRTVEPAADGTFRVGGLPPGEYFVVAYPNIDADPDVDVAADVVRLDQFAGVASRITIPSGEKRRVELTLALQPDTSVVSTGRGDFSGTWTLTTASGEGLVNSPASQLQVGPGTGRLVISQRGDRLRIASFSAASSGSRRTVTVEYGLNGEPVSNPFYLEPDTVPSEVTSWRQGNRLVSMVEVFLPGESVPRHYVETLSISPEGILSVRIERVGFADTRTMSYRKAK